MSDAPVNRASGLQSLVLRLCAALALTVTTLASPAQADNAFLLQLGTFDSEQQATQKWEDVKAKNGDLLNGLNLHIAEVALPPENKTTYRTQAGPLNTRDQATSLCNSLQKNGVQCYVVETAMFGSGPASDETPAAAPSAPEAKGAPTPARTAVASEEDSAHSDDPDYIPPPMDSGPVVISSTGAPLPAAASPAELAEMPVTPAPQPKPVAARPPVQVAEVAPAPAARTFHDDDDDGVPAPVIRKSTVSVAQAAPAQPSGHYVPGREPHFLDSSAPVTVASAPPAPAVIAPPVAAQTPKESPGFFGRLFGFSSSEPAPAPAPAPVPAVASGGIVGSVNVAEAVRVPLTNGDQAPRQKIVPVLPTAQTLHPLGGSPTESTDKTLWAQISYFRDETQALTFFRQFLAAYPQFSDGLRLRITRPFASTAARVSLRVGPFGGADDVRTVCAAAARWNARCTVVRDIGASMAMNAAPAHAAARSERTHAAAPEAQQAHGTGVYWAQLGTFHSSLDAWDAWRELKATHHKIAAHMRPTVTTPASSSATGDVYRLRAGPFTSEDRANDLCNKLQAASTDCLVISEH